MFWFEYELKIWFFIFDVHRCLTWTWSKRHGSALFHGPQWRSRDTLLAQHQTSWSELVTLWPLSERSCRWLSKVQYVITSNILTECLGFYCQSIGFMGPGLSLLCLNYAKSPSCAAILMTVALSLSSFSQAGFLLNMQVR